MSGEAWECEVKRARVVGEMAKGRREVGVVGRDVGRGVVAG